MSKRTWILLALIIISISGGTAAFLAQRSPQASSDPGCISLVAQNGQQSGFVGIKYPAASMWLRFNDTATVKFEDIAIDAPPTDIPELIGNSDDNIKLILSELNIPGSKPYDLKIGDEATIRANQNGTVNGQVNGEPNFGAFVTLKNVPRPGSYTITVSCDRPVATAEDGTTTKFKTSLTFDFFHVNLDTSFNGTKIGSYLVTGATAAEQNAIKDSAPDSSDASIMAVDASISGITKDNYDRMKNYLNGRYLGIFVEQFCNGENLTISADGAKTDTASSYVGYYANNSARGFRWPINMDATSNDLFDYTRDTNGKVDSVGPAKKKRFSLSKSSPLTVRDFTVHAEYTSSPTLGGYSGYSDSIYLRTKPSDAGILKTSLVAPTEPVFVGGNEIPPISLQYSAQNRSPIGYTSISSFVPTVGTVGVFEPASVTGPMTVLFKDYGKAVGAIPFSVNTSYGYKAPNNGGQINDCQSSRATTRMHTYKFGLDQVRTAEDNAKIVADATAAATASLPVGAAADAAKTAVDAAIATAKQPEIKSGDEAGTKLEIAINGWDKVVNADDVATTDLYSSYGTDKKFLNSTQSIKYKDKIKEYFAGQKLEVGIVGSNGNLAAGYEFSADQTEVKTWHKSTDKNLVSLGNVATSQWTDTKASQIIYVKNIGGAAVTEPKIRISLPNAKFFPPQTSIQQDFPVTIKQSDVSLEIQDFQSCAINVCKSVVFIPYSGTIIVPIALKGAKRDPGVLHRIKLILQGKDIEVTKTTPPNIDIKSEDVQIDGIVAPLKKLTVTWEIPGDQIEARQLLSASVKTPVDNQILDFKFDVGTPKDSLDMFRNIRAEATYEAIK